jgi:2-dehydropantoate 2-reductase
MAQQVSIAVVGAGAIGGALGAALGDAGRAVTLCDRVAFKALTRTFEGETRQYEHPVVTSPQDLRPVDWVFLCTKAHQVAGTAEWLEKLIEPETRVAVMQNGVDHATRVQGYVDPDRVVPSILLVPVEMQALGEIVQRMKGRIQISNSQAGQELALLFQPGDVISVETVSEFKSVAWSKLAFNAVGGAIGCLALQPLGALGERSIRGLVMALLDEVTAVGRAEGAVFADDFAEQTMAQFTGPFAKHWESIAVDRREGRHMEWQARNAVIGEKGRAHGIATPLNDAVTALLALIDARLDDRQRLGPVN